MTAAVDELKKNGVRFGRIERETVKGKPSMMRMQAALQGIDAKMRLFRREGKVGL
jgi:hypothetical protein